EFDLPHDAQVRGIGVVHQDYNLFNDLNVAANVYGVSQAPPRRRFTRRVDKPALEGKVTELLTSLGIELAPSARVGDLGAAERKFVEIARAMLLEPSFLILDEPTASLEPAASKSVLGLLERLRDQGVGLCFVSHRLDEVLRISDRITVLRDGDRIDTIENKDLTEELIAELIIGRKHEAETGGAGAAGEDIALGLSGLKLRPGAQDLDLSIRKGESFGLTGLLGSGAAELVGMIGGAKPLEGDVEIRGNATRIRSPRDAAAAGVGFIPEDRKATGLVPEQSVAINISLASLKTVSRALGWLRTRLVRSRARDFRERLDIRTRSVDAKVKTLSGGNQQKVMLAKWLASGVEVLAIEEPTHGIDIGAKAQVHELLRGFARDGGTIIVASTDVEEVLAVCDRIGIMWHGSLIDVLDREQLTHQELAVMGAREPTEFLEDLIESGLEAEAAPAGDAAGASAEAEAAEEKA
ncbi:MAG: sugar ABC transporter ATP-binding protein, partial [Solirubrobacterales bacterium]